MQIFTAVLFSIFSISVALVSNSIMGAGMWFWIILISGIGVGISPFVPASKKLASVIAGLVSTVSVCAVLFGLLTATIGGSFKLDGNESLLLFLFALVAICGYSLVSINKKLP